MINEGEETFKKLVSKFDPSNPPMLANYERLENYYKMPSKNLLETERDHFIHHINILRRTAKQMVKRAKKEAKEVARKVLEKQVAHVNLQFENEIKDLLYKNSFIKEELD
jgi:hypothetical protein